MTQQNENKTNKKSNLAPLFLGATALLCLLGIAGSHDCREEMEMANRQAGKEIYSKKDMPSKPAATALGALGASCLIGAFASARRNER